MTADDGLDSSRPNSRGRIASKRHRIEASYSRFRRRAAGQCVSRDCRTMKLGAMSQITPRERTLECPASIIGGVRHRGVGRSLVEGEDVVCLTGTRSTSVAYALSLNHRLKCCNMSPIPERDASHLHVLRPAGSRRGAKGRIIGVGQKIVLSALCLHASRCGSSSAPEVDLSRTCSNQHHARYLASPSSAAPPLRSNNNTNTNTKIVFSQPYAWIAA